MQMQWMWNEHYEDQWMGNTPVGRTWDRCVFLTQISGTAVITGGPWRCFRLLDMTTVPLSVLMDVGVASLPSVHLPQSMSVWLPRPEGLLHLLWWKEGPPCWCLASLSLGMDSEYKTWLSAGCCTKDLDILLGCLHPNRASSLGNYLSIRWNTLS